MSSDTIHHVVLEETASPQSEWAAGIAPQPEANSLTEKALRYTILVQSRDDLRDPHNAPSISMWQYLLSSGQLHRLNEISVYARIGSTATALRFLYMNDVALAIWEEMKKPAVAMGRLHRPPRDSSLSFGMPFSE